MLFFHAEKQNEKSRIRGRKRLFSMEGNKKKMRKGKKKEEVCLRTEGKWRRRFKGEWNSPLRKHYSAKMWQKYVRNGNNLRGKQNWKEG